MFTQPQLLAVLCLMRYEDWTFREAENRLAEHAELRAVLGLKRTPDYTTLYRFLRRVEETTFTKALAEAVVRRLPAPPPGGTTVAVDATGLADGAISTFFIKRVREQGQDVPRRHWLKWLVVVDVPRRAVLAQHAKLGPANDSATLRPLVDVAKQVGPIRLVLADAKFDSEGNNRYIHQVIGADSIIPARHGKANWRVQGTRARMHTDFPKARYSQRALAESVISAVKRKLSARAPGQLLVMRCRQALLLGLAYNIYRL